MGNSKENLIMFEGWFTIVLPDIWEYEEDEEIINIYSICENAKGAIQISLFHRTDFSITSKETADINLKGFILKNSINIDINTYKIIETPNMTFANVCGIMQNNFIKAWTIVDNEKMLLVTYISEKKTRELSTVENIVYSINFVSQ